MQLLGIGFPPDNSFRAMQSFRDSASAPSQQERLATAIKGWYDASNLTMTCSYLQTRLNISQPDGRRTILSTGGRCLPRIEVEPTHRAYYGIAKCPTWARSSKVERVNNTCVRYCVPTSFGNMLGCYSAAFPPMVSCRSAPPSTSASRKPLQCGASRAELLNQGSQ
jgi:hypothetical protein